MSFVPVRTAILTVSDSRTAETDRSGDAIADHLTGRGHIVAGRLIVTDEVGAIRDALGEWIADDAVEVVIATGGTGLGLRDVTPEALAPLVTRPIPGFGELFRMLSYDEIGTSTIQSRAEAAMCDTTLVFLLPGSTGAVKTAMTKIILEQLDITHQPCNFAQLLPGVIKRSVFP
jgi:molybdenum cofactor biosynthesis protein B